MNEHRYLWGAFGTPFLIAYKPIHKPDFMLILLLLQVKSYPTIES